MLTNAELLKKAKKQYRDARDHNASRKKQMRRCYDFYAGRQWSDEERQQLESTGRAAVVMNRIKPRVSAVVGMEISNRQEIRYAPREASDQELIDLVNAASEWTRDQSETEDHETDQFQDLAITGMGWTETIMSYEDNMDGLAVSERRDPLKYDWDPRARQANLADARYSFYSEDIDLDEFTAMGFSANDAFQSALGVHELWEMVDQPHDADNAQYYPNEVPMAGKAIAGKSDKKVRLVDYQYIAKEKVWRVMTPTGAMRVMYPNEESDFKAEYQLQTGREVVFEEFKRDEMLRMGITGDGALILPYVAQTINKVYRAYISGDKVLEHEEAPCPYSSTHHCMTGWRDQNTGFWLGMVDGLIDPQEWSNKFFSQAIFIYTVNPKGGAYIEKDAVDNPSDFEDNYSAPDAITWVKPGALSAGKIMERRPGQYPSDLDKLSAFAIDSLPALDGLTPELMGQVSRDQPGILEKMRQKASMTVLAPLFDSKRRYHKRQGKVLLHYISRYFTKVQLERIVGKPIPDELMETLREQDIRNYDVIVDDAPTSPNQKEFNLTVLLEMIRQAPNVAPALAPILIKNSPLTLDVQQEILQAIDQFTKPEATPQYQQIAQELQKTSKERDMLKTKAQVDALKIAAKTQTDAAKIDQKDEQSDDMMALERDKLSQEFDLKMAELRQEFVIALMEMKNNLKIAEERPAQANGGSNG